MQMIKSLLTIACLGSVRAQADDAKAATCQALVIGSTGDKEAFVVGAIKGLIENRPSSSSNWNVVVGTGTPFTSVFASTYALGEESKMASALYSEFMSLTQSQIYSDWNDGGVNAGYSTHSGMYNNSILRSTLNNAVKGRSITNTRVSSVSATALSNGNLYNYNSKQKEFNDAVMASAAIPGSFPTVQINGKAMVSGSVRMGVDVFHAINLCRSTGASDSKIILDIILSAGATLSEINPSKLLTPKVNDRNTDIKTYDAVMNDVGWAKIAYPHVNFRQLVYPSAALSATDSLQYSSSTLNAMAAQGVQDAKNSIKSSEAMALGQCDTPTEKFAPRCTQDRDCYSWAVAHCADAMAAETGRCNLHVDSVDTYGACEYEPKYAQTCCVEQPWEIKNIRSARKVSKRAATQRKLSGLADKCYSVAVSGGGDRGSYEAGLIKGLVDNLPIKEVGWSVVTGISVGSIVGAGMGLYRVGDESKMADYLVEVALSLNKKTIYKDWFPLGIVTGLCCKKGLYDTSPERQFLTNMFQNGILTGPGSRKLTIGATQLNSGFLTTWNEEAPNNVFVNALMCSSAIPGVFPDIQGIVNSTEWYSDGGTKMGVDVFNTVVRCRDEGYDDADIVVDVLLTAGLHPIAEVDASNYNTSQVNQRVSDLIEYDDTMDAVGWGEIAYPNVNWRYLILPSTPLPGDGKTFDPSQMAQMVKQGEADAKAAVQSSITCEDSDNPDCHKRCAFPRFIRHACSIDKDCYNYAVTNCQKPLAQTMCVKKHGRSTGMCRFR